MLGNAHEDDDAVGQLIYSRPDGKNVTIDYLVEEEDPYGEERDCVFIGIGRVLDESSADNVFYAANAIDSGQIFFSRGGLTLEGECLAGGDLNIGVTTSKTNSMFHVNQQAVNGFASSEEDDFDPNEIRMPLQVGLDDDGTGQLIYAAPDGTHVTIDFLTEDLGLTAEGPHGDTADCGFLGTARVRKPGDPKRVNFKKLANFSLAGFFGLGGLELSGSCVSNTGDHTEVFGRPAGHHRILGTADQFATGAFLAHYGDPNFNDKGDDEYDLDAVTGADNGSGHLVFSTPGGTHVAADYLNEEGEGLGGTRDCIFLGNAEISAP